MSEVSRQCGAEGCGNHRKYKLYCAKHQDRIKRTGSLELSPKAQRLCSLEGCSTPHYSRGYCKLHYSRLMLHGDVRSDRPAKFNTRLSLDNIKGRILERCETRGDCIEWRGYTLPSGYGIIRWDGRTWVVHRAMWTAARGPIPDDDDWTIDHLCRNKRCVNVDHLEVVTRTENSLRAGGLAIAQGRNKQRSGIACRNGHPRIPENVTINGDGHRICLPCKRASWAKYSAKIKQSATPQRRGHHE